MTKQQKGTDYSALLIWSAALVTVVRYAAAFIASDATQINAILSEIITIAMGISGIGMGVLDVIGGTYLFTGWQKKMPSNGQAWPFKFKILTFFAIGLIVNGILILIPFTMSRVAGVSIHHILGDGFLLFGWASVVNVAPYLLIGGVAVGNTLVTIEEKKKTTEDDESSAETFQKLSEKHSKPTTWLRLKKTLRRDEIIAISKMQTDDICHKYNVSPRTATNWRNNAKEEIKKEVVK